ncbi:MAG: bifunctional homocysteine S-methyltransferase/methylenetetrahydrofolate reductase [Gemmatimonadetes bacterium]|nr:bifunctional homocysteine S-methyltransferase/methylenetetrahydrofolate reductase [Gemmatimonadota bacterium]
MDGATGTMLYARGVFVNVCYDELNLKEPKLVTDVHEDYVRAGAEIIETNTFGANPVRLSSFGLEERTEEINRAAAELALRAAGGRACVVGAIGPLGIRIEPFGPTAREEAVDFFERQVTGLLEGGVAGFVLETFGHLDQIHCAYKAVRNLCDLPVIAQMTIEEDGRTSYGTEVEVLTTAITSWGEGGGADVVGLNCSVGPSAMLEAVERMSRVTDRPISAQPNAGLPKDVSDRKIYLASPDYVAQYALRMIGAGARFIGGCCGTTPDHIKKIRDFVAGDQPRQVAIPGRRARDDTKRVADAVDPAPLGERSPWGRKIAAGEFVTSIELMPPSGTRPDSMIKHCEMIKEAGVDAVSLLDGPRAQLRMGALLSATIIEREVGIETVFHYSCRDRNMFTMISDLLGASALGLRNVLIVTGDPPRTGPYADSTAVFDIDSIGLTNVVNGFNCGVEPGGSALGNQTRFVIGVAVNPGAVDLDRELERFEWKVDAGADFAVTQPVFELSMIESFLKRIEGYRIPLIVEIWPPTSLRNAQFLANEVPGVIVPEWVLERMAAAQERGDEAARDEGVSIAREVYDQVKGFVQGVQVSAPMGRIETALNVLSG